MDAVLLQETPAPHRTRRREELSHPLVLSQSCWADVGPSHPPILPEEKGCWPQQRFACSKDCGIFVLKREEDRMDIIHSSSYTHCAGTRTSREQHNTS